MPKQLKRTCICTLIVILCASQAAAFDLQIGHLNFNPAANQPAGHYQSDNSGLGASITIPLGFSNSSKQTTSTLNGQDLAQFTEQDAKDSAIVIMLVVVGIAVTAFVASESSD